MREDLTSRGDLLLALAEFDDCTNRFIKRQLVASHAEFVECVQHDLDDALKRLENNPQHHARETEDETTQHIVDIMEAIGYVASHNKQAGGNVDITIENKRRGYVWIAEAKKFDDVGDLREGYLQLATRYTPQMGPDGKLHGGLLAYLRRPDASTHMNSWKEHLLAQPVAVGATVEDCKIRLALGFLSEHKHASVGIPIRVWHVCVLLHFKPEDKSGRTAKKYQ